MKYILVSILVVLLLNQQTALGQTNSLKNYCKARILFNKLVQYDPKVKELGKQINEIVALTKDPYLQAETYKKAVSLFRPLDSTLALKYAIKAIQMGASPENFKDIFILKDKSVLQEARKSRLLTFKQEILNSISNFQNADQYYRTKDILAYADIGLQQKLKRQMIVADSINAKNFLSYLRKNGWPNFFSYDTIDNGISLTYSFSSMLSHWDEQYTSTSYKYAVRAAEKGNTPWYTPITINSQYLWRRPIFENLFYTIFGYEVLYDGLRNLMFQDGGAIDWNNNYTILEFLALINRLGKNSPYFLAIVPSYNYAKKNLGVADAEMKSISQFFTLFGIDKSKYKILYPSQTNLSSLPNTNFPLNYIAIKKEQEGYFISAKMKDLWLLDNIISINDFNSFFTQR